MARLRYTYNRNGQKMMIPKEVMRAKGLSSPDFADALMMAVWLWKNKKPTAMRVKRFNSKNMFKTSMSNW